MIKSFIKCNSAECNFVEMYFNDYQECKVRTEIVNVKSNDPLFCPLVLNKLMVW